MTIKDLTADIHQNAKDHGWWDEERSFGDIISLCHSELSEALEEFRNGKPSSYFIVDTSTFPQYENCYKDETDLSKWDGNKKLEGTAIEMADCIIRILDWAGKEGINMEKLIEMKHQYNKSRPYRHGNKRL